MNPSLTTTPLLDAASWQTVNDTVMGGVSSSEMLANGDGLRFQGVISLENNGGFASVHCALGDKIPVTRGLRLRVRGDGRRYQLGLRQNDRSDAISWRAAFDTDHSWRTVDLPLADFIPMYRGRVVAEADVLDPAAIQQVSFLLADKQAGAFQLDIAAIEFLPAQ